MQTPKLHDRLGASLRAIVPAPATWPSPTSMWDLLSAIERAEHEQILRPKAEAWAAAHPKLKQRAG